MASTSRTLFKKPNPSLLKKKKFKKLDYFPSSSSSFSIEVSFGAVFKIE
jgi:hypothetical protein